MAQYPPQSPYGPPPAPGYGPPPHAAQAEPAMTPGPSSSRPAGAIAAVKAVFDDPEWKSNVLIGLVFLLIPIVGPIALSGWMCEVHQRLVRRHPRPVPKIDFGDFAEYIKRGLNVFLVQLVISLPLTFIFMGVVMAGIIAAGAAAAGTNEPLVGIAVSVGVGLVGLVFLLLINVLGNAATTRAELTENFSEALSVGKLMGYAKETFGMVLVKTITFGFVSTGIVLLGLMLCYFGLYPAMVVIQIAAMHLRHQIYDAYLARGGEPIALKPVQPLPSEARLAPAWTGY
jgi:hypothetical protein